MNTPDEVYNNDDVKNKLRTMGVSMYKGPKLVWHDSWDRYAIEFTVQNPEEYGSYFYTKAAYSDGASQEESDYCPNESFHQSEFYCHQTTRTPVKFIFIGYKNHDDQMVRGNREWTFGNSNGSSQQQSTQNTASSSLGDSSSDTSIVLGAIYYIIAGVFYFFIRDEFSTAGDIFAALFWPFTYLYL